MSEAKHVYQAISAVMEIMSREGISKDRRNEQQGYQFRGIDEVYNSLSAHLAANKLLMLPRVIDRSVTERATRSGGVSTYVVLTVEFDLVSALDGSTHMIRTMGEAMDSADKATNKGMSAAMKYACLMVFLIPTKGDNDADAWHPQKARARERAPAQSSTRSSGGGGSGPTSAASSAALSDEQWVEWSLPHVGAMRDAQSAGELKSAFATAWREAEHRHAPTHIMRSLEKAKDDLKGRFAERKAS